jgi:hypothetical protein
MLFYTHYIDQFCKSAANFMITKIFKDKKFNLFENSSVFCLFLFNVKFPDDDLEKIETWDSLSAIYVKVYILIFVHFLVFSVKLRFRAVHRDRHWRVNTVLLSTFRLHKWYFSSRIWSEMCPFLTSLCVPGTFKSLLPRFVH